MGTDRTRGALLLAFVAFLWGTTFVVIKGTVQTLDAGVLVLARFAVAAVVFLPLAWRRSATAGPGPAAPGAMPWEPRQDRGPARSGTGDGSAAGGGRIRPATADLWRAGLELGGLMWIGYATQAAGLAHTTATRSAFITALHVVLLPVLAVLVGRRIRRGAWLAAALAVAGVALLSNDGAPPNVGDLYTVVTAVTYAAYILRLERHAARFDARALTWVQVVGVLPFAVAQVGWAAASGHLPPLPLDPQPWLAVLYLGLVVTALTTWLQTIGQASVDAAQAAVIYTTEPAWAAAFAAATLGERLGVTGVAGAALVVLAVILGQRWSLRGSGRP